MSRKKRRKRNKGISILAVVALVMAIACGVIALVPVIYEAAHPKTASAAEPELFKAARQRTVMSKTGKTSRETCSLLVESGQMSSKEAEEAKKAAAEKKIKEAAGSLLAERDEEAARENLAAEEERQIEADRYEIMGASSVTVEQITAHFNAYAQYPSKEMTAGGAPTIKDFAQIICDEASYEGVRPEVVYAQAMVETGWLRFGGDDSITQYNFAGLGTVGDGNPGLSFPDVRTGIRAQVQHLKAYACDEDLVSECVDPRFNMIQRGSAPYVQWLGIPDNPYGVGWAGGKNYGETIMKMIVKIRSL